jgi:hypothetical protein
MKIGHVGICVKKKDGVKKENGAIRTNIAIRQIITRLIKKTV